MSSRLTMRQRGFALTLHFIKVKRVRKQFNVQTVWELNGFYLKTFKCIFLVFTTIITQLELVIYCFTTHRFHFLICEVLCCICILFIFMVFGIEFSHLEVLINITQPLKKLHESYQFMLFWIISQNNKILRLIDQCLTPTLAEFQLYGGV